MSPEAIIIDLDGTAVDSPAQKIGSPRLSDAVQKLESSGVKVCAATGRPKSFAEPVLTSIGLTKPCIVAGGTNIINPVTHEVLWSCNIPDSASRKIVETCKRLPYKFLWNDYKEDDYLNGGWSLDSYGQDEQLYFFEACFVPHEEAPYILELLEGIEDIIPTVVIAQKPGMNDIHITNKVATKEHAVAELSRFIGVNQNNMTGIGDGHNDLHLFNAVGYKVAMGNAVPELQKAADEVIGHIKDDGLAEYFEKILKELA